MSFVGRGDRAAEEAGGAAAGPPCAILGTAFTFADAALKPQVRSRAVVARGQRAHEPSGVIQRELIDNGGRARPLGPFRARHNS